MKNKIEFFCWENEGPTSITLEPEGMVFEVRFEYTLSFVSMSEDSEFKWAIRSLQDSKSIILYPESSMSFSIQVYENEKLVFET